MHNFRKKLIKSWIRRNRFSVTPKSDPPLAPWPNVQATPKKLTPWKEELEEQEAVQIENQIFTLLKNSSYRLKRCNSKTMDRVNSKIHNSKTSINCITSKWARLKPLDSRRCVCRPSRKKSTYTWTSSSKAASHKTSKNSYSKITFSNQSLTMSIKSSLLPPSSSQSKSPNSLAPEFQSEETNPASNH